MKALLALLCALLMFGPAIAQTLPEPPHSFTIAPQLVQTSYYDYFFSSYNTLPLRAIPAAQGGGYLLSYHAMTTPQAVRRAYLAKISATGAVGPNAIAGSVAVNDGFPALAYDEQTQLIFNAWHCNFDADTQSEIVVKASYLGGGFPSPIDNPAVAIDAPYAMNGYSDNNFLWAQLAVGPSPLPNFRRLYVLGTNYVSHTTLPTANVLLAYRDYNSQGFTASGWNYASISELDAWSVDNATWRRTFLSLAADSQGRVYVAGYHSTDSPNPGAELHVFLNESHGAGTWRRVSASSALSVWIPLVNGSPWLGDSTSLDFRVMNSSHLNAVVDGQNRLQISGTWALTDNAGSYFPAFQFIKQFVYDPATDQIALREVFPVSANPAAPFTPWDIEPPWGEVDSIGPGGVPNVFSHFPYCHWDASLHSNAMMFHYNNVKTTLSNDYGLQATLWQDTVSAGAVNSSRINIALSSDHGQTWSPPLRLSASTDPELQSQTPMWACPADRILFTGYHNGRPEGKLGLVYFDDNAWGSESLAGTTLQGGDLRFAELKVSCPPQQIPTGSLNLHVQNDLGESMPGAVVRLGEWNYETDAAGNLQLPQIGFSTWDLSISEYGYYVHDSLIEIFVGQTLVLTVTLQPLPPVTLSAWVRGNDQPSVGMPGVAVTLSSPLEYETSTDANGYFFIPNLRVGRDYSLTLETPGYAPWQGSGLVLDHNFTLPDITLTETGLAPLNVAAELNPPATVLLTWDARDEDPATALDSAGPRKSSSAGGNRYPTGYRIYLIPEVLLPLPEQWVLLHDGPLALDRFYFQGWNSLSPGTYLWGVCRTYNTGAVSPAGFSNPLVRPVTADDPLIPRPETAISRVHPNPFAAALTVSFSLRDTGNATLSVYNLKGQKVRELARGDLSDGYHQVVWDGCDARGKPVGNGIYRVVLQSGEQIKSVRAVLLRSN